VSVQLIVLMAFLLVYDAVVTVWVVLLSAARDRLREALERS
jgi:hypothetical protein